MSDRSSGRPVVRAKEVTIAWLCALDSDLLAARCMLDDEHELSSQSHGDFNSYVVGSIGPHKIAMVFMDSSTTVEQEASNMLRTFPNVQHILNLGIGNAISRPNDQPMVGDVVIASPRGHAGGVIGLDDLDEANFGFVSHYDPNPPALRNAANTLRLSSTIKEQRQRVNSWIWKASDKLATPLLPPPPPPPGAASRQADRVRGPQMHYGPIASDYTGLLLTDESRCEHAMKVLAEKHDLSPICLIGRRDGGKLASVATRAGYIAIRGITDVPGTLGDAAWRPYASFAAAAYAKELVLSVPPRKDRVSVDESVKEAMESLAATKTADEHECLLPMPDGSEPGDGDTKSTGYDSDAWTVIDNQSASPSPTPLGVDSDHQTTANDLEIPLEHELTPDELDRLWESIIPAVEDWHGLEWPSFGRPVHYNQLIMVSRDAKSWQPVAVLLFEDMLIFMKKREIGDTRVWAIKGSVLVRKHLTGLHAVGYYALQMELSTEGLPAMYLAMRSLRLRKRWLDLLRPYVVADEGQGVGVAK